VGTPNSPDGTRISEEFFKMLEDSVLKAESYRGKILSLEQSEHSYSGESAGITVHKLRTVERDQVILPDSTLQLLERNVIQFVQQRQRLSQFQQATKKGILFYGPPGTGKTHTIHYLARALAGHTTLLVAAEQVGLLAEYMTLARLLQPSIVVLEDVDLIARDRENMTNTCEEVLLNKLLNEMDGLKEEADILFILTTNRPEALESALSSRPGRVDQAIEFPLPDEAGRKKLIKLYARQAILAEDILAEITTRTAGVSAAFIKELMRRSVQFHIERNGTNELTHEDVDSALDEMLFAGGSLNLKLLGASSVTAGQRMPVK
jgi:ATP-dependent 26S proteasome regulatory subunit